MNNHVLFDIKLNRPELPAGFLPRKGLEARLEEACSKDFILVSGPAGYGKSLAVSAWARTTGRAVLWFSLGPEDSSLASLASLLSYGLSRMFAGDPGSPLPEGPDSGAVGVTDQAPRYLAALLARQVRERLSDRELVLVLDDYHLCDGEANNSFILELSNQSSSRMKILISGRSDPGLPISRLRAQNRIDEIRIDDLRFSAVDLAAFLAAHVDRPVPEELQSLIDRKTEGWPAGLQMLCLAMGRAPEIEDFVRDFSASHRFILDYLMEEVLAGLDEEWIGFLYRTSIAEPFSAGLCAELCGIPDAEDRLRRLDRMNLFLIKLDGDGHWYRYHHLFRDLLRMRAQKALEHDLPGLHGAASRWYRKEGLRELAFLQLMEGGFTEECFRFLEEESRDLYIKGGIPSLLGLYERLPFEAFQSHPEACVWFGWLLASTGKVRQVPALVAWAEEAVRRQPDEGIRNRQSAGLASIKAMTANRNGNFAAAESEAAKAKELFPEGAFRDRAVASYIRATALILGGRLSDADRELEDSHRLATAGGDTYTQGMALSERARLRILEGSPKEALTLLARAEVLANPGGAPALWCGMVYIYQALAYRASGDDDKALSCALRGVDLARLRGNATPLVLGYRLLFDLYRESGQTGRCGELLASMEGLLEEFHLYPDSVRVIEEARSIYAERIRKDARGPGPASERVDGLLSRREAEVLELLALGCSNQEIADRLFLSVGTVKTHLHNISEKLGAANRTETVALARRHGYLKS
ncbi:MAG TPA: LuxR C-terminal-related transcriptional regulator [Spirochaetia bacterium]|nr:LuxR C-terminal-related transcriptional regulator [Spirochaetales bacterium]HRY80663.1 LuxR C-terminal-related transcriptional regulator [Spirochaetia bacterium]